MTKPSLALALALALLAPARPASAADEPERVVMKLDDFLRLYEANKALATAEKAPRDHAIASARYQGEVLVAEGDPTSAVFTAKMRIENLKKDGWARVPILPATVALQSAKIGNAEAAVVIENDYYTLITKQQGAFDLSLSFAAGITTTAGKSNVGFELVPSGATSVSLAVPVADDLDFTVPGAKLKSDKVEGGKRIVEATLPATGSLVIEWQREIPEAAKQQSRVYAEVYTLVSLGEGLLRATASVSYTILFAGQSELRLKVPKGMTILSVTGNGIRDWKLEGEELKVALNYAAEGSYSLAVELEQVIGEGSKKIAAPIVVPQGVERAKGYVGVESRGNLEISAGEVKGATTVDVRSLPAAILGITSQPVLLGYKYLGADAQVPLEVAEHEDIDVLVTILDQIRARTMWTPEGRRITSVRYQIRNNRRQFLRVALPAGAELWSVSVGGRAVQPAKAGDGRVMIPLLRSQTSGGSLAAFNVELVYVESGEKTSEAGRGTFKAELPRADAPSTYVAWTVYSPTGTKVKKRSFDGSLRQVRYLSDPIPENDVYAIETMTPQVAQQGGAQADDGSLGEGAVPVPVSLPLQGKATNFEKLLALDEALSVEFRYKGLKL
ncbi:MAG: hypothetical protein H6711_05815 [Myxococcales bacterium]|nr:hypothetical protein [Myxococcales bacterium]